MTRTDFFEAAGVDLSETRHLFYCDGYKYQSRCPMVYFSGILPEKDIFTDLIVLRRDGWMWVAPYFAWDGASGPAIDTASVMRASHFHDGAAALMRMGKLPMDCRFQANETYRRLMITDGAFRERADLHCFTLDRTKYWADPKNSKRVFVAP
jgi:hypothetical protein